MLIFAICWLLNIYGGCLMSASLLEAHWWRACQRFTLPFHYTALPHIKQLSVGSTHSFLRLTNVLLKYRYVFFHCYILLYTFVVLQVECMWRLLSTMYTVKPHKLLVSLWFHCQWNHQDCTVSIPMYCAFNHSFYVWIYWNQVNRLWVK